MPETLHAARVTRAGRWLAQAVLAALMGTSGVASAAVYSYVEWSAADVANGTASGLITLPDQSTVGVSFAATTASGAPGTLYGAQINGQGTNFWMPATPYISSEVENPPPDPDILRLSGGDNETYTVKLSEPIKDPIMAILSLGQSNQTIVYDFDAPFTIVSQGTGYYGGSDTALVQLPNDVLQGTEGHGTIQFLGTFSTFSWTVPKPEVWHGFTFGIRTTERLEPTPDGGAGGQGDATGGTGGFPGTGGRGATGSTGGFPGTGGQGATGGTGGFPGTGGQGARAGAGGAAGYGGLQGRGGAAGATSDAGGGGAGGPGNGGSAGARPGQGGGGAPGSGGQGGHGGAAGRGEPSVAGLFGGKYGGTPSGPGGTQGPAGSAGAMASGAGGAGGTASPPTASGGGCSCGVGGGESRDVAALALALGVLGRSRRRRRST